VPVSADRIAGKAQLVTAYQGGSAEACVLSWRTVFSNGDGCMSIQQQARLATAVYSCTDGPGVGAYGSHLCMFTLCLASFSFEAVKLPLEQLQRTQTQDKVHQQQQEEQQEWQQNRCCRSCCTSTDCTAHTDLTYMATPQLLPSSAARCTAVSLQVTHCYLALLCLLCELQS
jgi:hypothetical protein